LSLSLSLVKTWVRIISIDNFSINELGLIETASNYTHIDIISDLADNLDDY
jgi:hypothetical protein